MTRDELDEKYGLEDLLFMDPPEVYDPCILGVCERFGAQAFVVYDYGKVIAANEAQGMTHDEAEEYFSYNQLGAWVGDRTPGFVGT